MVKRLALPVVALTLFVCAAVPAHGQGAAPAAPQAVEDPESARANAYLQAGNVIAALPLYEHLAARAPDNPMYAERLAFCLSSKAKVLPPGEERSALLTRARLQAERAKALGDTSSMLQVIFESINRPDADKATRDARLNAAETEFTKGDFDAALAAYREIAASDPTSYEARLFAGDVYFRKHDLKQAAEWFGKAIEVNPDLETAYRYWGDALATAGDNPGALSKFIDAIVAEPYARRAWMGLTQWAQRNGVAIEPPHIQVPKAPTRDSSDPKKPGVTIQVDQASLDNPQIGAVWLSYSATRAIWQTEKFAQQFPAEKTYRHSLAEEVESLRATTLVLSELKVPENLWDASIRNLVRLNQAGMLEPYVLINAADDGIAKDYDAFRKTHRELVHDYIAQQVLHRKGE